MTAHAAASPSSAEMWMNCPASITKSAGMTRPSSRYAREGTAAHTIAEMIIGGCLWPPGKITIEGEQFIVGLPMLRALNPYIDYVQGLQAKTKDVHVEQRVKIGNGALVWGTADCAALDGEDLYIADLKYGMGVPVSPDSAQLMIYALAAIDTLWRRRLVSTVTLTVIQPRLDPVPKSVRLDPVLLAHRTSVSRLVNLGVARLVQMLKLLERAHFPLSPARYWRISLRLWSYLACAATRLLVPSEWK